MTPEEKMTMDRHSEALEENTLVLKSLIALLSGIFEETNYFTNERLFHPLHRTLNDFAESLMNVANKNDNISESNSEFAEKMMKIASINNETAEKMMNAAYYNGEAAGKMQNAAGYNDEAATKMLNASYR